MNEAQFTETVIQLAQYMGWKVAHFRPAIDRRGLWRTAMSGDPGFPDLVLARRGRVIFAELKSETGRVAPAQQEWIDALSGAPSEVPSVVPVFVWQPHMMDEITTILRSRP